MVTHKPAYTDEQLAEFKANAGKQYEYKGKTLSGYECTQQQRKYETAIRRAKDRANAFEAAGDKTNAARERRRARELGREYREFSEHVGLSMKTSRTQTLKSYDKKNIINNITVADIEKANVGGTVSQTCIDEIGNALGQDISKYDAVTIEPIDNEYLGTPVFRTVVSSHGGWCNIKLEINENVFGGRSLEEINSRIYNSFNAGHTVTQNIAEAVKHEAIHATLAYQRNFAQYEALGELLKDIHISGVSKTAYQNGEECLCETAILLERKADVPEDALKLWNKYFGGNI